MDFTGYNFNVQIWEENGGFNYAVTQEFDDSDDFETLGFGRAGSLEEASSLAGGVVETFWHEADV